MLRTAAVPQQPRPWPPTAHPLARHTRRVGGACACTGAPRAKAGGEGEAHIVADKIHGVSLASPVAKPPADPTHHFMAAAPQPRGATHSSSSALRASSSSFSLSSSPPPLLCERLGGCVRLWRAPPSCDRPAAAAPRLPPSLPPRACSPRRPTRSQALAGRRQKHACAKSGGREDEDAHSREEKRISSAKRVGAGWKESQGRRGVSAWWGRAGENVGSQLLE